jgi:hypothetical protein
MQKVVNFAIREMGEVYAIDKIISLLQDYDISWIIHTIPYNSDLRLFNPE